MHSSAKEFRTLTTCAVYRTLRPVKKLEILKTAEFEDWLKEQAPKLRTMIQARLDLVSLGHFGNHKRFDGLIELKWLNGTRIYLFLWGSSNCGCPIRR